MRICVIEDTPIQLADFGFRDSQMRMDRNVSNCELNLSVAKTVTHLMVGMRCSEIPQFHFMNSAYFV